MTSPPSSEPYLGYLKTEMTIMGVLSAFAATAGALLTEKLLTAEKGTMLSFMWRPAQTFWLLGLVAWLAAALLFYRQRSFLAFLYGQLALTEAKDPPAYLPSQGEILVRCDSWETWIHYRQAFMALGIAAILHGSAVLISTAPAGAQATRAFWLGLLAWLAIPPVLIAAGVQQYVYTKFADEERPWECFKKVAGSALKRSSDWSGAQALRMREGIARRWAAWRSRRNRAD